MSAADTTSLEPELAGVAWRIASIADARPIDEVRLLLEEAGLRVDHVERHDEPMIATIERVETRLRALRLVDLPVLRSFNLRRGVDLARRAADAVRRGDGGYMVLTAAKPRPRPRSRLQGKRREEASRMERHTLDVKGERLTWYEQGAGSVAVVFLHGIPTEPALWGSVVPLVHGARCLAFEMLGYADSIPEGDGRDISLAAQAARVVRWLDALDIDRAVLVGHDLGGGIAQIVAVEHTDRCAGLVLTNAVAYDSWPIPSVKAMRAAGTVLERTPARLFQPMLSAFVRIGHDDRAVGAESARLHWPPYTRHGGAQAFVRQIRSLRTEDTLAVTEGLTTIDVPARIVWSAADRFQKVRYGERLARDLRAPLTRLDGARHFVPEDHPQPLAAAVDEVVTMQGARR